VSPGPPYDWHREQTSRFMDIAAALDQRATELRLLAEALGGATDPDASASADRIAAELERQALALREIAAEIAQMKHGL
jgi:hypothetical protein